MKLDLLYKIHGVRIGGDKGYAILPYEYEIREAWGVTTTQHHSVESVSRPKSNILRIIVQKIILTFRALLERKE